MERAMEGVGLGKEGTLEGRKDQRMELKTRERGRTPGRHGRAREAKPRLGQQGEDDRARRQGEGSSSIYSGEGPLSQPFRVQKRTGTSIAYFYPPQHATRNTQHNAAQCDLLFSLSQ